MRIADCGLWIADCGPDSYRERMADEQVHSRVGKSRLKEFLFFTLLSGKKYEITSGELSR